MTTLCMIDNAAAFPIRIFVARKLSHCGSVFSPGYDYNKAKQSNQSNQE